MAKPVIHVLHPGLLTTVQDLGRPGFRRFGVPVSGALDSLSLRIANLLVGNPQDAAGLEITLYGPKLKFLEDSWIAIAGANLSPQLDGQRIDHERPIYVKKGSILSFGKPLSGCRAYLAVEGGIVVPEVLGSRSTYLRGKFGGFAGRALQQDDVLQVGEPSHGANRISSKRKVSFSLRTVPMKHPVVLRIVSGAHTSFFSRESRHDFASGVYQILPQSDRMGYRLSGPTLSLSKPMEMISDAVVPGTIQVPREGQPIVLLSDSQTTGGYPQIAHVITVDLPLLAQCKPGESLCFRWVTLGEAQEFYRQRERELQILEKTLQIGG